MVLLLVVSNKQMNKILRQKRNLERKRTNIYILSITPARLTETEENVFLEMSKNERKKLTSTTDVWKEKSRYVIQERLTVPKCWAFISIAHPLIELYVARRNWLKAYVALWQQHVKTSMSKESKCCWGHLDSVLISSSVPPRNRERKIRRNGLLRRWSSPDKCWHQHCGC